MVESWNDGVIEASNQNPHDFIDFLVLMDSFGEKNKKMDV